HLLTQLLWEEAGGQETIQRPQATTDDGRKKFKFCNGGEIGAYRRVDMDLRQLSFPINVISRKIGRPTLWRNLKRGSQNGRALVKGRSRNRIGLPAQLPQRIRKPPIKTSRHPQLQFMIKR